MAFAMGRSPAGRQAERAFVAKEEWEHGSVYEPNLAYHEGRWKMWYVAGSNHDDYFVHGYAESEDGRTGWTKHEVFAPPEMKMFDFCVRQRGDSFDAIFARVWLGGGTPPTENGLWWCRARNPSGKPSDWSAPIQRAPAVAISGRRPPELSQNFTRPGSVLPSPLPQN